MPALDDRGATVRINTLWLTNDESSTGQGCAVRVEGLAKLAQRYSAVHALSADVSTNAKVHTQKSEPNVIGKEISILIFQHSETNGNHIISQMETFWTAGTDLEIEIHDSITLTVAARPSGSWVNWDERSGGFRKNTRFNFICTARIG